jgi:hypothetical protein
MLNMGAKNLVLVDPADFDLAKAEPLATFHARHILETARVLPTLREALSGAALVLGTTARTGGWRKGLLSPAGAAGGHVLPRLAEGGRVALVFGPEDRGLTNEQTSLCDQLVMIPAHPDCTSLNLRRPLSSLRVFPGRLAARSPKGPHRGDASFEGDALEPSRALASATCGPERRLLDAAGAPVFWALSSAPQRVQPAHGHLPPGALGCGQGTRSGWKKWRGFSLDR